MKWVPIRAREALTSSFYTVFCTDFESDIHFGWKCVFCMFKRVRKIAKNMKSEGESVEKIIKYTGLSKDEIEKL